MPIPREITDQMVFDFRARIYADKNQVISDGEIRTGLAAVFGQYVWPEFRTEPGEDGWEREVPDPQERMAAVGERLAEQIEAPTVISDAQWRAVAAGVIADQTQPTDARYLIPQAALLAEWIKTGEVPS